MARVYVNTLGGLRIEMDGEEIRDLPTKSVKNIDPLF
jgi:hypothetical protein